MKITRASAAAALVLTLAAIAPAPLAAAAPVRAGSPQLSASPAKFHLPYSDPDQAGWLTLCNKSLQPITHGSITAKPFVYRVVSSVGAPRGYFAQGAKATLYAYQPREQTASTQWSGLQLGPASLYSNRRHPMAQFTPLDLPLAEMTAAFPPIFDHLLQLRLYVDVPGEPQDPYTYGAADIQVTGNTWKLVAGNGGSCSSGKVEPIEKFYHFASSTKSPSPSATGSNGAQPGQSSAPAVGGGSPSSTSPGANPGGATAASGSSNAAAVGFTAGIIAVVIAVLAAGGVWWRRRRRVTG
jgi:hypothetical protein